MAVLAVTLIILRFNNLNRFFAMLRMTSVYIAARECLVGGEAANQTLPSHEVRMVVISTRVRGEIYLNKKVNIGCLSTNESEIYNKN